MALVLPTTKKEVEKLYRVKYGIRWEPIKAANGQPVAKCPDVFIEQYCLKSYDDLKKQHPDNILMTWEEHFERFVELIWDNKECGYKFTWNPYAKRMLREVRNHRFLGVSGHASSGKSQFGAIWGLANFLISPTDTRVLVTSTSLQEAKLRIWGVIERYWDEAEKYFARVSTSLNSPPSMPGKLVASSGKITGFLNGKSNDLVGLTLIAGGKGNDGDASTKIGFKSQGKLILVADELPLLTHKLYGATSNLLSVDGFQMIATGNFTSSFDPFGMFVEPEEGWSTITEDMYEWKTRIGGYCIRFDGEQSPNVVAKKVLYPGLLTEAGLQEIKERHGEKSPDFYRQVKSFPCPTGQENMIYSEPELIGNFADHCGDTPWLRRPTPLAFLDPSFSTGGDAAAATFALLGDAQVAGKTITILEKVATIDLMMKVNARSKDYDRNEQLADLFNQECNLRGVAIEDRGVDATGGGDPFATLLAIKMGRGFQLVHFGGAASDKPVSSTDTRPGTDRFVNKVSELWYVGKEFVLSGQIRGLDPETILELINRTYKSIGKRIQVEPKDKMKERTSGRSPDRADSWVGVLEVARRRYKFMAAARAAVRPVKQETPDDWFETPKEQKGQKFRDFFSTDVGFHDQGNFAWGEDFH
jgi:hypothetical protein